MSCWRTRPDRHRPDGRLRARPQRANSSSPSKDANPTTPRELSAALARYSRARQTAVAGFDLTFSPVKSVSALWAVAPPEVATKIEQAHHAAVADAIAFIENHALFTREGKDGARQVETRGLIAAAFTHRDSRAGDPDLHTHVAVANKVQTKQGKWLSIYGRVLHQHVVAASETYNTALERHLVEALGVQFAERPSGDHEKRPIREIVGVDRELCEAWSRRRADIVARQRELTREFGDAHGRTPTPVEAVALAQQANLETREAKHEPRSLAEQRMTWRGQAVDVHGSPVAVDRMVQAALHPTGVPAQANVSTWWVREMAKRVLDELEAHRATWQAWHVHAEVHRQISDTGLSAELVAEAVGWVVDEVTELSVNLTPDRDPGRGPTNWFSAREARAICSTTSMARCSSISGRNSTCQTRSAVRGSRSSARPCRRAAGGALPIRNAVAHPERSSGSDPASEPAICGSSSRSPTNSPAARSSQI
jgi:conjugative relaxase-like TrwC/TraI family protein